MTLTNLNSLTSMARIARNINGPEVLTVPLDKVVSKAQIRKRFRNIDELAASLKSEGLQSPIIVSPANARGEYVIQKGERRWRAAKVAGFETIDVIINKKGQSTQQQIVGELVENIQRDDLTALEIANALGELLDSGMRQTDIAKSLGKSRAYVSKYLALLKLPECVMALFVDEIIEDAEILSTLRVIYDEDPAHCVRTCDKIRENNGITRQQAREVLSQIREKAAVSTAEPATESVADVPKAAEMDTGGRAQDESFSPHPMGTPSSSEESEHETGLEPTNKETAPKPENPFLEDANSSGTSSSQAIEHQGPEKEPWVRIPVDAIEIKVTVLTEDEDTVSGYLLVDRISANESEAWVLLDGNESPSCVSTNSIQVQGVGKRNE